ncbi:putative disease resistance RPP13-like protein 1 [Arachis stenosperma]|uniref:putative disease resistance RPP13-like protein 1 n=1 Tax=Arachis stenosperma TaxID=217475 RepID=UPI0025AC46EC|nr:putative disease resistance RPP13-like protein 1 [Arachis stenosperma]
MSKLKHLRVLSFHSFKGLDTLPDSIGELTFLRYLDLSETSIRILLKSFNLFERNAKGNEQIEELHILNLFPVGKQEDNGIKELGRLLNLHGSLEIKKLENVVDVKDARSARIIEKKHLEQLALEWSSGDDMVSNTQTERDILDSLQPHTTLKVVEDCPKLENMAGEKLPSSLLQLQIKKCPLLAEHCKKKHEQIWPKISYIPTI